MASVLFVFGSCIGELVLLCCVLFTRGTDNAGATEQANCIAMHLEQENQWCTASGIRYLTHTSLSIGNPKSENIECTFGDHADN